MLAEGLVDLVLGDREGKGTNPKGLSGRGLLVVEDLSTLLGGLVGLSLSGVVDTDRTAVNLRTVLLDRLGRGLKVGEFHVAETTRLLGVTVEDNSGRNNLTTRLELGLEPVVVNVPRELANENVGSGFLLTVIGPGLLCRGNGLFLGLSLVTWVILARVQIHNSKNIGLPLAWGLVSSLVSSIFSSSSSEESESESEAESDCTGVNNFPTYETDCDLLLRWPPFWSQPWAPPRTRTQSQRKTQRIHQKTTLPS